MFFFQCTTSEYASDEVIHYLVVQQRFSREMCQTKITREANRFKCCSSFIAKILKIALLNDFRYKTVPIHQVPYVLVNLSESFITEKMQYLCFRNRRHEQAAAFKFSTLVTRVEFTLYLNFGCGVSYYFKNTHLQQPPVHTLYYCDPLQDDVYHFKKYAQNPMYMMSLTQ